MRTIILSYLVIIGIIFSFLIPPFQKPDETTHFKKTVAVSIGVFNCPKNNQISTDKQLVQLIGNGHLQSIIAKRNKKLEFNSWLATVMSTKPNYQKTILNIESVCKLPSISYLPQAAGLFLSRLLHLNQYFSFFIGRFFAYLIFLIWFIFLYRSTAKPLDKIILLTVGLPMTIHQLSSYSYDGIQIMFSLTAFVALANLIKKQFFSITDLFLFALSFLGFIFSRAVIKITYPPYVHPDQQLALITNQPIFFAEMIVKTTYLRLIFYLQGLIAIFGWLEYGLDRWVYFLTVAVFIYLILSTKLPKNLTLPNWLSLVIFTGLLFVYLLIITINYLFWSAYAAKISEGTQGRYFLPFFPFAFYWLIDLKNKLLPKIKLLLPSWPLYLTLTIVTISIIKSVLTGFDD